MQICDSNMDHHPQNLSDCSLARDTHTPLVKNSCKSVCYFLTNPTYSQTINQHAQKPNLPGGSNN